MTAVGGILLVGMGINILEIKRLKVGNMLPGYIPSDNTDAFYVIINTEIRYEDSAKGENIEKKVQIWSNTEII